MNIWFGYDRVDEALWRMSIYYLMNAIKGLGHRASSSNISYPIPDDADVFVFYRCMSASAKEKMQILRDAGKMVVYQIDDYLFQQGRKSYLGFDCEVFQSFLFAADAVAVPSRLLFAKLPVENRLMYRPILDEETVKILGKRQPKKTDEYSIGWLAGNGSKDMCLFVGEILRSLDEMIKGEGKCVFHCFDKQMLGGYQNICVKVHPYVPVSLWRELYSSFAAIGLDAVIYPLDEANEFSHCKAEMKYFEAAAMGVPIVVSRMMQFLEFVREGENGFFASTPREFAQKTFCLLKSPEVVKKVSLGARKSLDDEILSLIRVRQFLSDLEEIKKRCGK